MTGLTATGTYLTAAQHRLVGGWRDVLDDLKKLSLALQAMPETCQCGDGAAHLRGGCPCCQHITPANHVPSCGDCERLLSQLRPAIDTLSVDTMRFWPATVDVLHHAALPGSEESLRAIRSAIASVVHAFEDIVLAAGTFRNDCRTSHLITLKQMAAALLNAATMLERQL